MTHLQRSLQFTVKTAKAGSVQDNSVIKTTGAEADFSGIIAVSAVAFVMVAGGAFYLAKSKKERA